MSLNDFTSPPGSPPAPPPRRFYPSGSNSGLAIAGFVLSIIGLGPALLPIFPWGGFIGTFGLLLAIVDMSFRARESPGKPRRSRGLAIAAIVMGSLCTFGALIWVSACDAWNKSPFEPAHGSCPHLYSFDGKDYRLDADPVSGALYAGAERDDLDRLEHLRPVAGQYRVRIQNDLQETDQVDDLALLVADHPAGTEVLPTQEGGLVVVRGAAAPRRAVDSSGADVRALLADDDGRMVSGTAQGNSKVGASDPRVSWTLDFPRPPGDRALLIVRGHNTPFAEEAFVRYLAVMGSGLRPLLEWAQDKDCAGYRTYLAEEIDRLGLPLRVRFSSGGAWTDGGALQPVGPATPRSQALPIRLPPGGDAITVRLEATPRFWEIDQVELAPASEEQVTPAVLHVRSAVLSSGAEVTDAIARRDGRHLTLHPGEHVDVRFDAPPAIPGRERTVIASLRGYYELDVGGGRGVNLATLLGHRLGMISLPRFAAELEEVK